MCMREVRNIRFCVSMGTVCLGIKRILEVGLIRQSTRDCSPNTSRAGWPSRTLDALYTLDSSGASDTYAGGTLDTL